MVTLQKNRPIDALQRIMTSFKHFEKKLDKLQDDVNFHGQTLSELRSIVTNLSAGNILSANGKSDENTRRPLKKSTAIQYEDKSFVEEPIKPKRKNAFQPLTTKQNAQNSSMTNPVNSPFQMHGTKMENNYKGISAKHAQRHRKAEAIRKATTVRAQKSIEKKRSKLSK